MANTTELITNIANLALALSFIVALIFGIAQVRMAARDRKEHFTLDILGNFKSREFAELMCFMAGHEMPSTYEEMNKLPTEEWILIVQFSQQMESLGMLVAERYINIDLVDKTLGSFVLTSFDKLKPMILDTRQTTNDPFMNEYFQWLAEKVDERMKTKPRKPFNEK
jgi:hypothetical protein